MQASGGKELVTFEEDNVTLYIYPHDHVLGMLYLVFQSFVTRLEPLLHCWMNSLGHTHSIVEPGFDSCQSYSRACVPIYQSSSVKYF